MIRPSRVRAIAGHEFRTVVYRASYLLVTFGLPLLFSTITGGMVALQADFLSERIDQVAVYGLVDDADLIRSEDIWSSIAEVEDEDARAVLEVRGDPNGRFLALDGIILQLLPSRADIIAALRVKSLDGAYAIQSDYLESGGVDMYVSSTGPLVSVQSATVEPVLRHILIERILVDHVPRPTIERVLNPMEMSRQNVAEEGTVRETRDRGLEILVRTAVPFLLGVLLLTALLSASGYLVQAITIDKESKVVEVLLSSADPDEILTGKLLGLGAAGLLQFFVWTLMVVAAALIMASATLNVTVPWQALAISPLIFVLGYLFIGSLMLATGSLGTSAPEAQKLTIGWAVLAVIPLMMILILLELPHGALAKVFTWIPFSAPLTLVVRLSVDPAGVMWWEVAGAILVLLISTWFSIRIGARLFRVGLLLTGSRPPLRDLLRQARLLD